MARPHGARRRSGSNRRRTAWALSVGGGASVAQSAAGTVILGSGAAPTVEGLTIARIRGELVVSIASQAAGSDEVRMTYGICQVTDDAFAIGATAMPDPNGDAFWDGWMWHQFVNFDSQTTSVGIDGVFSVRIPIDVKAMRKLPVGMTLVLLSEFSDESGTIALATMADTRMLVFLP